MKFKLDGSEPDFGDNIEGGKQIYKTVIRKKSSLYNSIKKFAHQKSNDGIFAENIIRLTLDGINLNHFYKNHPHVDICVVNPIPGVAEKNEILSVKSTKYFTTISKLLTDTKSIKIESLFSYVIFAHYNYDVEIINSPLTMLNKAISIASGYSNVDYKKIVQITTYYLMYQNISGITKDFESDILNILKGVNNLTHGSYTSYNMQVLRGLSRLNIPISLGVCYIDTRTRSEEDTICVIEKSNPILLKRYWLKLLDVWCTRKYFGVVNAKGEKVTKYLRFEDISKIFGIERDFPIRIEIGTGTYSVDTVPTGDKIEKARQRLYVATKFKDANFKDQNDRIVKSFSKMIDVLEENPRFVIKFDRFIKNIYYK